MEDRLVLWLPDGEKEEAPKKRFEVAEPSARLNASIAIPVFILAFAGLFKQLLRGDDKADESPQNHGSPHLDQAVATLHVTATGTDIEPAGPLATGIDPDTAADLDKVIRIADYLKSLSGADPSTSYFGTAGFTLGADGDIITATDFANAIARSNSGLSPLRDGLRSSSARAVPGANDNRQEIGTPTIDGEVSGEDVDSAANDGTDLSENGDDDDDEANGDNPARDDPATRLNRAPVLTGPVNLGNGLINLSVIITMGELLAGASDPDGDPLIVRFLEADDGELQRVGLDRWLYTPPRDEPAEVSFRYQVSDGTASAVQTAHLEIMLPEGETITGTDGNDILLGTPYADLIDARGGDDMVYGREGGDIIHGGDGDDRLVGGDGDDVMWGGFGADVMFGGAGDDTLFGEQGDDILHGGDGDDIGFGGSGSDSLFGEAGDDVLDGGDGDDMLYGGAGNDLADGGPGDDFIDADAGDDVLIGGGGNDALLAGSGDDRLSGGDGDDVLHGGDGNDMADGGAGDDTLCGGQGDDILRGGDGDDIGFGGSGSDTLFGEAGDDVLDGGAGDDFIDAGADEDVLSGGDGNDVLHGGGGDDVIFGDAGNDTLHDGEGRDRIVAGDDDDRIILYVDGEIDEIDGGDGIDTVDLSQIVLASTIDLPDGWVSIEGRHEARLFEVENVRGGSGDDRLVADDEVNIMTGGGGNDIFVFRSLDALTNEGGPSDHIVDFSTGDRIDLSRVMDDRDDFAGQKLFFAGAASAKAEEIGALTYEHRFIADDHETTVISGNLFDDADAEFEIVLEGHHELTEQDFLLAARELEHSDHG